MLFSMLAPVTSCWEALGIEAQLELFPKRVVALLFDLVGRRRLQAVAPVRGAALRAQGEATRVIHIDQFVVHRRRVCQQPQPADRIYLLERLDGAAVRLTMKSG